ncbi:GNAT family N-acetyltransferase [Natrinema sp. SYSU A 869]|uniref:GNAT family N-acetyltransferase n=1 Tax=Natrinema sp. SYSU A 869 TaxID=2871694 RepID=UPI001CA3D3A0|nr:GNAT family N-acetyltransferase [Natrinema sp. SYSU A 869]
MQALERPTFESEAGEQLYQYVERNGPATRNTVRETVSLPPEQFRSELEQLKAAGYITEEGGSLQITVDIGTEKEYTADDFTYTIRPGRHTDVDGIVETIRDVTSEETYIVAESVAEQLLYEDAVTRHNTVESRVFFVATADETVIGWTHLTLPQTTKLQDTAQLTVGVREEYREAGVGSNLLQQGLDWAEATGYRKVYNSVPASNEAAIAFLEAHDWTIEAIRKEHYTIGDQLVDEVMMAYTF